MRSRWFCGAPPLPSPSPAAVKAAIIKYHASVVSITGIASVYNVNSQGNGSASPFLRGVGVLIHPTLVLTTHSTIPSPSSIKDANISVCLDMDSLSYVKRKFVPEIFFETDSELDVTIVSCEMVAPNIETLALDTTRLSQRALRPGRSTFVMGCQANKPEDVIILEGGIVETLKAGGMPKYLGFKTGDGVWMPGSAGFDEFGTFSFIVTSTMMVGHRGPKQQAISLRFVKRWVEPLWRRNRDEIFQGPQLALEDATPAAVDNSFKRPSMEDKSSQKQTFTSDTAVVSTPIRQTTLKDVEKFLASSGCSPESSPQRTFERIKPTSKTVGVEDVQEETESDFQKGSPKKAKAVKRRARNPSPNVTVARERKVKGADYTTLKMNKGLKRLMDKGNKESEPEIGNVSVQTELSVTDADVKPVIIVSRPGSPEPGARPPGEGVKAKKGQRERWSLPADGHGLDFLRDMEEAPTPPPTVIRPSRASVPLVGADNVPRSNNMKEAENVPAWMDRYYARGRSLSELPSRATSAGTTPPRPHRQVVSDADPELDGDDSASISGSSSRSLQRADSAYFKPTISYMQKRNPGQRDSILARQATQTALPRWS